MSSDKALSKTRFRRFIHDLISEAKFTDKEIADQINQYLNQPHQSSHINGEPLVPETLTDDKPGENNELLSVGIGYDKEKKGWLTYVIKTVGDKVVDFRYVTPNTHFSMRTSVLLKQTEEILYKLFRR